MEPRLWYGAVLLLLSLSLSEQHSRSKRDITEQQPRIVSEGGSLIFQTAQNHNITFRSGGTGTILLNDEDLSRTVFNVKTLQIEVQQLKSSSSEFESRLDRVEERLENRNRDQMRGINNRISELTNRVVLLEQVVNNSNIRTITQQMDTLTQQVAYLNNLLTVNECHNSPCGNGATCVDMFGSFSCQCAAGWSGRLCTEDVDECRTLSGTNIGCQHGATCINEPGSFRCLCTPNWYGVHCTESHDDCSEASNAELCVHGTCHNLPRVNPGQSRYNCSCDAGWTQGWGRPECNVDIDECRATNPPCSTSPAVICINTPGSFTCGPCPPGYTGGGFRCEDINECQVNNGGCSVAPRVQCMNTVGSRICGPCPPGYRGDGISCVYLGICGENNGGCHPMATCRETPSILGRTCYCPPGYVGSGVGPMGCTYSGSTPAPALSCNDNPCGQHGSCQPYGPVYMCICHPGWTGRNCNLRVNPCLSSPCRNGGTCTADQSPLGYACTCTAQYSGATCEQARESCGGRLTGETGNLSYPGQSLQQYPHGAECIWFISTSPDKVLTITFNMFKLEQHDRCQYDYLQIHDGESTNSNMIGRYCGVTIPAPLTTTQSRATLWFKSDSSVSHDGFRLQWTSSAPVCGGTLIGETHGVISSPGYPGNYPDSRDCVWIVAVQPGNKILFTLGHVAIEHHDNCSYDYLEIRDGRSSSDAELVRLCSTSDPQPVQTSGPVAYVRFHSDVGQSDRGFQISYVSISGCGESYTSDSGVLISPNYPNPYPHNTQCLWTITVPQGEVLTFTFTDLDIESHSNCFWDFVELRDGEGTGNFVGRYCGNSTPPAYVSSSNRLQVKFKTDISNRGTGFRATWNVACGGVYTQTSGELTSPYFPNVYPHDKECVYIIRQPEGSLITLTFLTFDIEASRNGNCSHDYLEVRSGETEDGTLVGRYCGTNVPAPIQSPASSLWLKFGTDGSVANHGFRLTYQTTNREAGAGSEGGTTAGTCGGSLSGDVGAFQSPFHPNTYPHGVNCTWFITAAPGFIIRLTFTAFSLEQHYSCQYDYVEVFDNYTSSGTLGRYCGSTLPPVLTSTDNVLTVQFIADSSIAHEGFSASYVALNSSTVCGGEVRDSVGLITSPNYPQNYPHNRECEWTIVLPAGKQVLLNITDFSMEPHPSCRYDYLEIRNGGFATSPLIGKYCGNTIDPVISSHGNRLYLKMKTDQSSAHRGFNILYDGTVQGCGGVLTSNVGSFVSPNYPLPYDRNVECLWQIAVSNGSRIRLHFVDFDMEAHDSCNYDYVEVRDGGSLGTVLSKFCGNSTPDYIESASNRMWIKFKSDLSNHGRGFHASYYASCNNILTAHSGIIESPNFPNPYPRNRDCRWIIQATVGNTVNASFSHFDIEGISANDSCRHDYVELRNGRDDNSPLIGRYCGQNFLPPPIATSSQYLLLRFVSDRTVSHNGFRLHYIINGCGGHLLGSAGTLSSPDYPQHYPSRRECLWTISTEPGTRVKLDIVDFNVEQHPTCDFDALEVYGGLDDTAPRLTQLCHTQTSVQTVTSAGNHVTVRFRSDSGGAGRGFNATYSTLPGGCGGNYTARSGTIMSQNYPNPYLPNSDCLWIINTEAGRPVVFSFEDFDVEDAQNCQYDYVALYATPDFNSSLLSTACGSSLPSPATIRAPSNQLFVRMRTDGSVAKKGFKATYSSGCGGLINAEVDGTLSSPGWPSTYEPNSNCTWVIQAAHPGDRITLTLTHIELEASGNDNCTYDYLEILEGDNENSPVIGRYCGTTVPAAVTSVGLSLVVRLVTDSSRQMRGFQATYSKSSSACGGVYSSEHGAFNSPRYPDSYANNIECVWSVTASPGNRIQLAFSSFNLESSSRCSNDYVEIREGRDSGRLIGKFCGSDLPPVITVQERLWVKLSTNQRISGRGFMAQYNSLYGGTVSGLSGQIASPLYPSNYPASAHYEWIINARLGRRIVVSLQDIDIELHPLCAFDYVEFKDGGTANAISLGRFCGVTTPPDIYSSSNQMHVTFNSDSSVGGRGFLINWASISANEGVGLTTPAPQGGVAIDNTTQLGCGGNLSVLSTYTQLTSPGWPNGYAPNLRCFWTLVTTRGSSIRIQFNNVSLESHGTCIYDYVAVYEGSLDRPGLRTLGKFCGLQAPTQPIVSRTNFVIIRFNSDSSVNRSGFALQYKQGCGGALAGDNGVILSPEHPAPYPAESNCTWTVEASAGKRIQVNLTQFSLPGQSNQCDNANTFLELFNGQDLDSPSLAKLCGPTQPSPIITSSNYLTVNFQSQGVGSAGQGFRLEYRTVQDSCGGTVHVTEEQSETYVTSPNYPQNYPIDVDCIWVVSAPANKRLRVDFLEPFELEEDTGCRYDYVELRDGSTENSEVLVRSCGRTTPSSQRTSGNQLWVRFRSDESLPKPGFKAKISFDRCGGILNAFNGSILSPNYPDPYPNAAQCEWLIQSETGHYITLSFESLALQYAQNCLNADYVVIRDGNRTGPVLQTACGTSRPAPVNTSDNTAHVMFVSNDRTTSTGFKLNFVSSLEVCGGTLTTPTGTLTSPNYPGQYAHSRLCTWVIQVEQGRKISLSFTDLDMEDPTGVLCRRDFVEVINGRLPMSPVIGRYCGTTAPSLSIESSSNSMTVRFITDGSISGRGFQASYHSNHPAECGGSLDSSGALIESPGFQYNNSYNASEECVWTVNNRLGSDSSIALNFIHLDLEDHGECNFDFVEIREGTDQTGHLIGRFCRNDPMAGPVILSPYPSLWIRFVSDILYSKQGFQLQYNFTGCGGILRNRYGTITSPGFPSNYNISTYCVWKIEAPEGYKIKLWFTVMDFGPTTDCSKAHLEVLNGGLPNSPSVAKLCTSNLRTIRSQSNEVRVIFRVQPGALPGRGFRATYSQESTGCGGVIHAQEGTISSPNYPSSYNDSTECVWDISVGNGYHIVWNFSEPFQINSNNNRCNRDYVEILEMVDEGRFSQVGKWCGNSVPPSNSTTSSSIRVKFRSNRRSNGIGFSLNFTAGCGATYYGQQGVLMSPGYPAIYDNNLNCTYDIIGNPQKSTILTFNPDRFHVEDFLSNLQVKPLPSSHIYATSAFRCQYDYLEVFVVNGSSGGEPQQSLGKFCGSTAPQPLRGLGHMRVRFVTDESVRDRGWMASFKLNDCGGIFTEPSGAIESPVMDAGALSGSVYTHNANCTWLITTTNNKVIKLRFERFTVEPGPGCRYDSLSAYEGPFISSARLIGRYCGNTLPAPITSASNQLTLNFLTDESRSHEGFSLVYRSVYACGGTLNSTSGTLQSLDADGDGLYETDLDCVWRIIVPENSRITLTFTQFELEPQSPIGRCNDFVEIREGMLDTSPLVSVTCGTTIPSSINSTFNMLYVRFVSDERYNARGFRATYTTAASTCGSVVLVNPSGRDTNISYPVPARPYPANQRCVWSVVGPTGQSIELDVVMINIRSQPGCSREYLEINDDPMTPTGSSVKICGSNRPSRFYSVGSRVVVTFQSSSNIPATARGFTISVRLASCNRTYESESGLITSPNYPADYPINARCEMRIVGPAGSKLSLYVGSLYIEPHPNCSYDFLAVYNSTQTTDDSPLVKLCGLVLPNPVFLNNNMARLLFVTDSSLTHSGFYLTYLATPTGCGGTMSTPYGSFTSPQYPDHVNSTRVCRWVIVAPSSHRITLSLSISPSRGSSAEDCQNSFVAVHDGSNDGSAQVRYCRPDAVAPIRSTTNNLQIIFSSTASTSSTNIAFRASFTTTSQYVIG